MSADDPLNARVQELEQQVRRLRLIVESCVIAVALMLIGLVVPPVAFILWLVVGVALCVAVVLGFLGLLKIETSLSFMCPPNLDP